jgi:hypothetical protein
MTKEKFEKIMYNNESNLENYYDNALDGLLLMQKYLPGTTLILGTDHDIIYSVDIDKLIEAGITEEDTIKLRDMNWIIEDGCYLACFV